MIEKIVIGLLIISNILAMCMYIDVHKSLDMMIDWDNLTIDEYPQGIIKANSHYCVVINSRSNFTEIHEQCHQLVYDEPEHFCGLR